MCSGVFWGKGANQLEPLPSVEPVVPHSDDQYIQTLPTTFRDMAAPKKPLLVVSFAAESCELMKMAADIMTTS
jgi:hypothetical protein